MAAKRRIQITDVDIGPLHEFASGEERLFSLIVRCRVERDLMVAARLTASSPTWTASLDSLVIRAVVPENTVLHGSTLEQLPARLRELVVNEVRTRLIPPGADRDIPRDPPREESNIALAFGRPAKPRYDDDFYIPFAVMVVEKMNRPRQEFSPVGERGTVFHPRGPYGRFDAPYDRMARSHVRRWVEECIRRGLITNDPWALTPRGAMLAEARGLLRHT